MDQKELQDKLDKIEQQLNNIEIKIDKGLTLSKKFAEKLLDD